VWSFAALDPIAVIKLLLHRRKTPQQFAKQIAYPPIGGVTFIEGRCVTGFVDTLTGIMYKKL
jgi:hypothetical protein